MDDVWIDAVEQFLKGDDWRNRVLSFVDNNCALYANDTGDISAFTHGQYDIWHEFKDLVDSCIGSVLSDLGGSEESFARACEDRLKERDKGRDANRLHQFDPSLCVGYRCFLTVLDATHRKRLANVTRAQPGLTMAPLPFEPSPIAARCLGVRTGTASLGYVTVLTPVAH